MTFVFFIAATVVLMLPYSGRGTAAEPLKKRPATGVARAPAAPAQQTRLLARRMVLLDRKRVVREQLQKSMGLHEEKIRNQTSDYETKKEMYDKNLISRSEVEDSERALTNARLEAKRTREWIAEDARALALAEQAADEESKAAPKRAANRAYRAALIRYDGATSWSLAGFDRIERFYRQRFGRSLPISAMGQSHTHDRLGLDHRDAMDVAVRPDSAEGRGLMAYLRGAGIPFIAFRGKMSTMSTGAHIHIGRPSPRLVEVTHQFKPAAKKNEDAERG
jgi:hypothetical protein